MGKIVVAIVVVLAAAAVVPRLHASGGASGGPSRSVITRVVDGDTIHVSIGGSDETVRLIGINTPETVDPRTPVECFGPEASRHTKALLPKGTEVRLVRDVEARDKYGRLLAYVYKVADGTFVNLELARDGFADLLTFPPNVAHVADFTTAVQQARTARRGLWAAC
jgi:micrococcal nuclease